jgi:propionyl-CoA synthetase
MSEQQIADLKKEINQKMREDVGAFAKLHGIIFMNVLPKTRSGKILRGTIKNITNDQPYKVPATIDDMTVLDDVHQAVKAWAKTLNIARVADPV